MWSTYILAKDTHEAMVHLAEYGSRARIVAGATDLILELERGARKGVEVLVDITRIPDLAKIELDAEGWIHLGPTVTHNDCVASGLIREKAYPLARACWEVGSPQIRNRGTVAGNIITASPANDTITPLMALDAVLTLRSLKGERKVPINQFFTGVRRTVLLADEMLVDIAFRSLSNSQRSVFTKFALRRAQAISLVNECIILDFEDNTIISAAITLGSVAPTIIHAIDAEKFLIGKILDDPIIYQTAEMVMGATSPINDIRGSAKYRRAISRVITQRGLRSLQSLSSRNGFPEMPVLLQNKAVNRYMSGSEKLPKYSKENPIITTINGHEYRIEGGHSKTLLRIIREDLGLIGTKEGCSEGECGACTVLMDGMAVMSCMVPAPHAHGAIIQTIEGIGQNDELHPVQQAFVEEGAVQCGYCTPGFIMSAVQLLNEYPAPTTSQIEQAVTGNLCRCTGYYKIIQAIEKAAKQGGN